MAFKVTVGKRFFFFPSHMKLTTMDSCLDVLLTHINKNVDIQS